MSRTAKAPAAKGSVRAADGTPRPRRQAFPNVLSPPAGPGKTSVARAQQERFPELEFAVSCTTRPRRP